MTALLLSWLPQKNKLCCKGLAVSSALQQAGPVFEAGAHPRAASGTSTMLESEGAENT